MHEYLKIGFVLDDSLDKTDGVQQYILTLGKWLCMQGHRVHYLVGDTQRTDVPNIHSLSRNMNVRFNGNNMSIPMPANRRRIKEILDAEQFDVLHVQVPYNPFLAKRIITLASKQVAVVGTFHILPYSWVGRLANRSLAVWLGRSLKRFDSVLAVSNPARTFAGSYFPQPITVIPNVVEPHFAEPPASPTTSSPGHIVFLGRLVKRKGCQELLAALKLVLDQHAGLDLQVTIAGKGPLLPKLRSYVKRHGLDSCVEFAGYVSEKQKYDLLASADIAVFPSLGGESFGIVLVEAMMASSGAVIAGNNLGYASVMAGHTNQLVDPSDTSAFAARLLHYLEVPAARQEARRWQKQRARTFDVANVGPKITKIYKESLHKRRDVP